MSEQAGRYQLVQVAGVVPGGLGAVTAFLGVGAEPDPHPLFLSLARAIGASHRSEDLVPYAAESARRARRLDAAAEELRKRLP